MTPPPLPPAEGPADRDPGRPAAAQRGGGPGAGGGWVGGWVGGVWGRRPQTPASAPAPPPPKKIKIKIARTPYHPHPQGRPSGGGSQAVPSGVQDILEALRREPVGDPFDFLHCLGGAARRFRLCTGAPPRAPALSLHHRRAQGITDVALGRRATERRTVSQDLEGARVQCRALPPPPAAVASCPRPRPPPALPRQAQPPFLPRLPPPPPPPPHTHARTYSTHPTPRCSLDEQGGCAGGLCAGGARGAQRAGAFLRQGLYFVIFWEGGLASARVTAWLAACPACPACHPSQEIRVATAMGSEEMKAVVQRVLRSLV